ncbi:MAG: glycosyltransferase [Chitinophagaceae bacterium]
MNQPIKEKTHLPNGELPGKSRILLAPLDWGLGHATRCIPIIKELLAQDCEVWLAGEGAQEELLKTEFPELPFLQLPGYKIKYAKTKKGLFWKMVQQSPKLSLAIRFENKWLKKVVDKYNFDAIISDNRYGLFHSTIPSIFITHQLRIKSPFGKWTEKIVQSRNYKYINRFTECWIPDWGDENNLAGELSHPELKPAIPIFYIGILSRFENDTTIAEKKNNLLVLLSGPEPQRSMLEEKIIKEISHYNGTATIVRGLPLSPSHIPYTDMIKVFNHLPAAALNMAMQEAEYVICRSGYSSVMDVARLHKKSIMIPTPGQTEQEYLADILMKKGFAVCYNQNDFSLENALKTAKVFNYTFPELRADDLLKNRIKDFLTSLKKG